MRRRHSLPLNYATTTQHNGLSTLVPLLGHPSVDSITEKANNDKQELEKKGRSRCEEDFIEVDKLGRGAYGSVYAVKNKLDGLMYAMKKIQFRNTSTQLMEKVLREVKTLALLNHPNVVRYHSCWIERSECTPPTLKVPDLANIHNHLNNNNNHNNKPYDSDASVDDCDYSSDDEISPPSDEWSDDDMEQFNPFKLEDDLIWPNGSNSAYNNSTCNSTSTYGSTLHQSPSLSSSLPQPSLRESQILLPFNNNNNNNNAKKLQPMSPNTFNMGAAAARIASKPKCSTSRATRTTERKKKTENVNVTTLFIVMQLYSTTLAQWLDTRPPSMVDSRQNMHIFHQICRGLEYIHSKGVIHRDLKPGNIFINVDPGSSDMVVCLGDFGLAIQNSPASSPMLSPDTRDLILPCSSSLPPASAPLSISSSGSSDNGRVPILSSSISGKLESTTPTGISPLARSWEAKKHTAAVGTLTYASPEQRNKGIYNEKTDIFSLGIIFFELYYPCETKMEKARVLADLRNRILPPQFLQKYPQEAAFALWLLNPNPDARPGVDEIMRNHLITDELIVVGRRDWQGLAEAVSQQRSVIQQQQDLIKLLEQKIAAIPSPSIAISPEPSPRFNLSTSLPTFSVPLSPLSHSYTPLAPFSSYFPPPTSHLSRSPQL